MRATLRGLARERKRSDVGDETPFLLTRWDDGRMIARRHDDRTARGARGFRADQRRQPSPNCSQLVEAPDDPALIAAASELRGSLHRRDRAFGQSSARSCRDRRRSRAFDRATRSWCTTLRPMRLSANHCRAPDGDDHARDCRSVFGRGLAGNFELTNLYDVSFTGGDAMNAPYARTSSTRRASLSRTRCSVRVSTRRISTNSTRPTLAPCATNGTS